MQRVNVERRNRLPPIHEDGDTRCADRVMPSAGPVCINKHEPAEASKGGSFAASGGS